MNFIVKRQYSAIASQLRKSNTYPLDRSRGILYSPEKHFLRPKSVPNLTDIRAGSRAYFSATFNVLLFSQIGPFAATIMGVILQKSLARTGSLKSTTISALVSRNRYKIAATVGSMAGLSYLYYEQNKTHTPITKRPRIMIFNKESYEEISHVLFKVLYHSYKDKLLGVHHKTTKKVNKIVGRLLDSNKEFDEIKSKDWKVFVIDDNATANAFVLPTGQIFVYTGLIRQCDNEDQLATILAHELSHTLMGHGNEVVVHHLLYLLPIHSLIDCMFYFPSNPQLSQEVLGDFILTVIVFLLWLRLPMRQAMVGTVVTSLLLKALLVLPKRRLIETEADFIGLILSAKTCYDVREGSAFWMKMATMETSRKWYHMSTHPSNTTRYESMDAYMEAMINIMKVFNCDELTDRDPRHRFRRRLANDDRTVFKKRD
jgi:hypothetical protein